MKETRVDYEFGEASFHGKVLSFHVELHYAQDEDDGFWYLDVEDDTISATIGERFTTPGQAIDYLVKWGKDRTFDVALWGIAFELNKKVPDDPDSPGDLSLTIAP